LSSSGSHREFHRLIREADEAHQWFSVATNEARRLELDATKVALATSEGEFATAQVATAIAEAHIAGNGLIHLDAWMDVYSH
jgi:hypothetical protein